MIAKRVHITRQAERDIDNATIYLSEEAGMEIAIRFFDTVHKDFQKLCEMPGQGRIREFSHARFRDMRQFPVNHFEKYLIFYRVVSEGIEIVRLLHGARDVDHVFNEQGGTWIFDE